jgi:SepF-like predicted cell division protein (DUF552 family)
MFRRNLLKKHADDTLEDGTFLDLGAMHFEDEEAGLSGGRCTIRMADVVRFEDIHSVAKLAYGGDIVILDYTSIANDPVAVKRMSAELKSIAKDTGGDVAGISKNLIALTPAGVRIDRNKVRPAF